jgi:hypothetical protein
VEFTAGTGVSGQTGFCDSSLCMRNRMLDWLTGNRPLMVLRYVLLTLIWLSVSTGLSLVSDLMPCFELSESAAAFYRFPRLSIGALVFYVAQMLIGYFFTTKVVIYWNVTLWKESRNFCAVLFVVIPMYFIGPIFVLNGPCDGDEVAYAARALDSWIRLVACFAVQLYIAQYWTLLDFIEGEKMPLNVAVACIVLVHSVNLSQVCHCSP